MVILFECVKNFENLLFPLILYCSLLFVNNRTMGFPKIDNGTMITIFFFNFQIKHQIQYADQFSGPPDNFYRNYGPLFMEPILAKMTSFWPKMASQRRRGKSVKSENCHANMVYGYIHEYKHQNSIQYIVPEKKWGGHNAPPMPGGHSKSPCKVGLRQQTARMFPYCDIYNLYIKTSDLLPPLLGQVLT